MTRRPARFHTAPGVGRSSLPVLVVLGAISISLILAACGGSSPASGVADNGQSGEEAKFADFARCLREHGINAEAATTPGGGHGLKVSPRPGGPHGPQQFEAAEKACRRYRPAEKKVNLSPQQRVEREEAVQKFAKCMREHGIKVEASGAGGGIQIQIHAHPGAEGAPDPESPAFQQAQNSCQKLLPGGGPSSALHTGAAGEGGGAKDGPSTQSGG